MAWTDSADCDVCISQYGERERKKINTNYCNTKGQTQVQQTTIESASKNIKLCVYGNYYLLSNKNYDYFVAADNASWHCAIRFDSFWWFGVNFVRCLLYSVIVLFLLTLTMIFFIAFRTQFDDWCITVAWCYLIDTMDHSICLYHAIFSNFTFSISYLFF